MATRSNISKPFVYFEDVLYNKNENMNKNNHGSLLVPVFVQNVFHLIAGTFLMCACFQPCVSDDSVWTSKKHTSHVFYGCSTWIILW